MRVLSASFASGSRGVVEAALAKAFDRPLDAVKRAGMLTGDIGRTAELAREGRLDGAELALFHPLKFMLASPAEDAAEILQRLGPTVWVEDKYDGIRCQLHREGSVVHLYSRDLHDISSGFPEVVKAATNLPWAGILDGELLAWREGTVLPFIALVAARPQGSVRGDPRGGPVIYVAWDVLGLDQASPGEAADRDGVVAPTLELPLTERRRLLETLDLPLAAEGGGFALSHLAQADSIDALEDAFAEARARRNEGLMVKDPTSIYSPGRRGYGWLKMKKALATIDCVVVGVEVGHGKRHGVLSDYTFAVRDEAADQLVTIGKAYSGLTDAEIATMTRWFEEHTISQHGRYGSSSRPSSSRSLRRDPPVEPPQVGLRAALPAHRRPPLDKDAARRTPSRRDRLYEGLQSGAEHLITAGARKATRPRFRVVLGVHCSAPDVLRPHRLRYG